MKTGASKDSGKEELVGGGLQEWGSPVCIGQPQPIRGKFRAEACEGGIEGAAGHVGIGSVRRRGLCFNDLGGLRIDGVPKLGGGKID